MISATAIGNLGRDPELKYTQGGTAVLRFSIASNSRKRDGGEWVDHTSWIEVVIFGKRAESLSKHIGKGSKVAVRGRIEIRTFEKKDGTQGKAVEFLADDLEFAGGERRERSSGGGSAPQADGFADEDLPF